MPEIDGLDVRTVLLDVIREQTPGDWRTGNMQAQSILHAAAERLNVGRDVRLEQILLTEWQALFRSGVMAWGYNLANPNPPFCHPTALGQEALEWRDRDPLNPAGYLGHLRRLSSLNEIADSYMVEALACYGAGAHKAAAVMVGAAAESLILDLRGLACARLERANERPSAALSDWRTRSVLNGLKAYLDARRRELRRELAEEYDAYWPAFSQQIRAVRNEAGHPTSISPLTADAVRASFLVFPELAELYEKLKEFLQPGPEQHSERSWRQT